MSALRRLARDIREGFRCECVDKDGNPAPPRCPCRGEGTDIYGNVPGPSRGCWHCQARYALNHRTRPLRKKERRR